MMNLDSSLIVMEMENSISIEIGQVHPFMA